VSEPIRWTSVALGARLDALEEKYTGPELNAAIVSFADTLTDEDRRRFHDVLLKRRRPAVLRLPKQPKPDEES
jgi:uncharacterized membrane protein